MEVEAGKGRVGSLRDGNEDAVSDVGSGLLGRGSARRLGWGASVLLYPFVAG